MSSNGKRLYKFGAFNFNVEENVLRRDNKPVSLTPKMLELLRVLISHHGQIVNKNDLMRAVWTDSFVEEGNLTFTIRQLRKALEDDAHHPVYIETVARRGYRFIAEVEEVFAEQQSKNGSSQTSFQNNGFAANHTPKSKKFLIPIFAACALLVGTIIVGSWYARSKSLQTDTPVLAAPFSSEKLSTNGKVFIAVISPDGKNAVYTNSSGGKQSVWLRQLESSNNVEIIPPSDDAYFGLEFSPDANFLYLSRRPRYAEGQTDIYRVSIFGGVPSKIISEAQGWISVSPDGAKISFVRCYYREEENCSLWIADALDGKNERKIASRPRPIRIGDNKISPDGKTVAFAVGQSENQANEFGLSEVEIESGTERELTAQKFFNIKSLAWLPDKNGLLLTASKIPIKNSLIWRVSAATGEVEPLTKDSESYSALSLDKEASRLVSTQVKQDFRLHLFQMENPAAGRVLADATTVAFAPNGKIIFSSIMSGNDEIWSINADGSGQRQLTNNSADESAPVISPADSSIFFASNRTGAVHVWRMNADGSNQTQITQKTGGFPLFTTPDGKWLYYQSGLNRTLWRVAIKDREEQLILNKEKYRFAFSPDGSQVAFSEKQGEERILTIVSLAAGQITKTFHPGDRKARVLDIAWLPDGKSMIYILANNELENNTLWRQPLDGGTPQQITDLGNEEIYQLALTPDGKTFAVVQGGWRHDAVLLKGLK